MDQPKVFIGAWQQPSASFAKLKSQGVNCVVGCTDGGPDTPQAWRQAALNAGLWMIDFPKGPDLIADALSIAAMPNCYAVMCSDEPDLTSPWPSADPVGFLAWKAAQLAKWAPVMNAIQGKAKRFFNFSGTHVVNATSEGYQDEMETWANPILDAVCCDKYSINEDGAMILPNYEGATRNPTVYAMQELKKFFPGKEVWAYLECTQIYAGKRGPTPDEMQQQIDLLIAEGGFRGVIWFLDSLGQSLPWTPLDAKNGVTAWDGRSDAQTAKFIQINTQLTGLAPQPVPVIPTPVITPASPSVDLGPLTARVLTLETMIGALQVSQVTDVQIVVKRGS